MIGLIALLVACAISYFITVVLVYLVTLCFGWTFSWLIATGIWLLMILLKAVIGGK